MSFIIEISLCGAVTVCTLEGEELSGQVLEDLKACNASGDCQPACEYILDNYKPEFRIVRNVGSKYENVLASREEKQMVCREIYCESDGNFRDERTAETYLVWSAAVDAAEDRD